jgi:hypothetical protein
MEALAVQHRHLSIPDAALFSPMELQIAKNCSEADFARIVRAVSQLDTAGDLWVCDGAFYAINSWGKNKGLKIMTDATGYKKLSLYNSHFVALNFPPSKRFPGYKANHYATMIPFPVEWRDAFLARHAGENLTCRGLRLLAVREFGSEPAGRDEATKVKKRHVTMPEELYERVRTQVGKYGNVCTLVENMLEKWLRQQAAVVPAPVVIVTPEPEVEDRPTYAEHREQQFAEGVQPIPAKEKKPSKPSDLNWIQWVPCGAEERVDSGDGLVLLRESGRRKAKKFYSEADAQAAEQTNFERCGYRERVVRCEVCSGGNARKQVYHVAHNFSSDHRSGA